MCTLFILRNICNRKSRGKKGWPVWQCDMDQRKKVLLVVRSIEKPLKAFSLRHWSPSFALIAHGTVKWRLQNFLLSYLWANDSSHACLQLLLRVGTPCSFFQAVLVQEERPVQHARCIVYCSMCFYCPGFLQFSAILVPGIAAQSNLDTHTHKKKKIFCVSFWG